MAKYYLFLIFVFLSPDGFAFTVSGTVTDRTGAPVSGAEVLFVDSRNPAKRYAGITDQSGYYCADPATSVETPSAGTAPLHCYPNPFNRQTVISFHLNRKEHVEIAVFTVAGQKVRVIESRVFDEGRHQLVWDGLLHNRQPVSPGLYLCRLQSRTNRETVKMLVSGGDNIAVPAAEEQSTRKSLPEEELQLCRVSISGEGFVTHRVDRLDMTGISVKDFVIDRAVWTPFSTAGNYLGVYNGTDYSPFFIKGVNIGTAVPGSWPGQLAVSSGQYARWFRMIAGAGFNTIRIYTLHFPRFYDEFARYNTENPDRPLYLLHGVWLNEEYPVPVARDDLFSLTESFDRAVQEAADCLHGNRTIGYRPGEAYGEYKSDVSRWVLGFIIGREVYAAEIGLTNIIHAGIDGYSGSHLSIEQSSPSEAWVAERLDRLVAYERNRYATARPVAFSSWPTLDPLKHPGEPAGNPEDAESLDLNRIKLANSPGGFFISYHAYPYYPNFISRDEKYRNVSDDMGVNPYLGYLRELRSHYTGYPVLVAEFGLPTSWGNARYSLSGMNHGGMTEKQQGDYTVRMFRNIYDSDYCGGIVFAWMDEWFKTTWITHPLTSERRNLWHNISSPENNYGLIRFIPAPEYYADKKSQSFNSGRISESSVWHDFAFFNIDATLTAPLTDGDTLWIAIDTYHRDKGESALPDGRKLIGNRAEFLLRITGDSAQLYVTEAYNLQGVTHMNCYSPAFRTETTDGKPWIPYRWQNDETWLRPNIQETGRLNICKGNGTMGMHQAVRIRNDGLYVRIPWTLLHCSDPSSSKVIDDDTSSRFCLDHLACGLRYLNSLTSNGIAVTLICKDEVAEMPPYSWNSWNVNPDEILNPEMFIETEKASLPIIREGLKNNPFVPKTD